MSKPSPLFKIVTVGDSGTGKSSIISTFVHGAENTASMSYCATMGIEFETKLVVATSRLPPPPSSIQESAGSVATSSSSSPSSPLPLITTTPIVPPSFVSRHVRAQIWDTAGQERFARVLLPTYFRRASAVLLVYDITDRKSFFSITSRWSEHIDANSPPQQAGGSRLVKILVGNKLDRSDKREVSEEEGKAMGRVMGCPFFEVSAKDGLMVNEAFQRLVDEVLEVELLKKDLEEGSGEGERTLTLLRKKKRKGNMSEGTCNTNCC